MDFVLSSFANINVILIIKLMLIEFLIGALIGVLKKEIARFQARSVETKQIIPANLYTSRVFENELPRGAFNLLALKPEFVIVDCNEDEVKQETFYSPLGDHICLIDDRALGSSVLSSPIYLCTVFLPLLLGFIASVLLFWLSPINTYAETYLLSGFGWNIVATWLPLIIHVIREDRNTSE